MERFTYGPITFAKGWTGSFADFKAEFEGTHAFKRMPPKDREKEMKKVHRDLTKHTKDNGPISGATDKSKKADADKDQ